MRIRASDLLDDVRRAFADLLSRNRLEIVASTYSWRHFGNAAVGLESPCFRLEIIRDRDTVDAAVAARSDLQHLYSIDWVIAAATGGQRPGPPIPMTPDQIADVVERNFDLLSAALCDPGYEVTRARLEEFGEDWLRNWPDSLDSSGSRPPRGG